jgi:hypothetical protein
MTNHEQLTQLDDLLDESGFGEETLSNSGLLNHSFEIHVTLTLDVDAWEQITEETEENIPILSDNLWSVEISKGSQENGKLNLFWLVTLELTSDDQHRLDGTETPIVVRALREQISAQEVKGGELLGEHLGIDETLRHEHVFANKLKIWNNDSNWSEKSLKAFWQL